ncbi:MAG TPA: methyltransferase [Anaeromyxobacteraceae bacterium]
MTAAQRALAALDGLPPGRRIAAAARRLAGRPGGRLAALAVGREDAPDDRLLDGRLLGAICERALGGAAGAVFTGAAEARILAAFGLARAAARRGADAARAVAALLGEEEPAPDLAPALEGLRVLDPCCGGGALLAAAAILARRTGARLRLAGLDLAPLAVRACAARLSLLGARAEVRRADALAARWPEADLVLANPPFLRHEALSAAAKTRAARRSGLSRQADLSAHLTLLALRHAPVAALVWPRALSTARSAAPLLAEARARGGFALRLSSRAAGSFAASVDTALAVWVEGHRGVPAAEAAVPVAALAPGELAALARGRSTPRLRLRPGAAPAPSGSVPLSALARVRFGMKSGCNAFFHLRPLGGGRFASALAGEVALAPGDAAPVLATLKEAAAPLLAAPARVLFRPGGGTPTARAYVALGESLGVHRRPTCAGRSPWWLVAPGRRPAPVLYPAKVGARAFAFLNDRGLLEDKKWHALFPAALEPRLLAAVLCATPVRLAVDLEARQLTGAQAIADVDCRVLAAAPLPRAEALRDAARDIEEAFAALARDGVTTDLAAALARPAQRALDAVVARLLGMGRRDAERCRRTLAGRVAARLAKAAEVRARVAGAG